MDISKTIKEARKAKGLSQQALADAVGVSRVAVTQWENNQSAPKRETAPKVAKFLGISLGAIYPIHTTAVSPVDLTGNIRNIDLLRQTDIKKYFSSKTIKTKSIEIMKLQLTVDGNAVGKYVGIKIEDDSMAPEINSGDILIFSEEKQPTNGCIILCLHKDTDEYYIRNYEDRGQDAEGKTFFDIKANNPSSPTYTCSNDTCSIIGIAVEHRRKL